MRGTRLDNGTVEGWTTDDIIDIITCTSPLITRTTYLIEYIMAIYLVLFSQIDEIMMFLDYVVGQGLGTKNSG